MTRILRGFSINSRYSVIRVALNFLGELRIIGLTRRQENDYAYTDAKFQIVERQP